METGRQTYLQSLFQGATDTILCRSRVELQNQSKTLVMSTISSEAILELLEQLRWRLASNLPFHEACGQDISMFQSALHPKPISSKTHHNRRQTNWFLFSYKLGTSIGVLSTYENKSRKQLAKTVSPISNAHQSSPTRQPKDSQAGKR